MPRPSGHDLHLRLPAGHWRELQAHCAQTGESASAVIRKALGDYLDLEHHTLWQLSTSSAVVKGVFGEALQVKDLADHGDFGIGTFEQLDGEGILLNGVCWQAGADGTLIKAPMEEGIPFWISTHFACERKMRVGPISDLTQFGQLLDPYRPSANLFVAIRVTGEFDEVMVRSVSRVEQGASLLDATRAQTTFTYHAIRGTLVGFWSPAHASSLNIPGYHLHFLSDDQRHGGHLLDLKATALEVEFDFQSNLRLALPETKEFLMADLSGDPTAALEEAETRADR